MLQEHGWASVNLASVGGMSHRSMGVGIATMATMSTNPAQTAGGWPWGPDYLPVEQRPLRFQVEHYVQQGYRVVSDTPAGVQLVKPKKFSLFWAFAWFCLGGVGLVVYLLYYASKRDQQKYLQAAA